MYIRAIYEIYRLHFKNFVKFFFQTSFRLFRLDNILDTRTYLSTSNEKILGETKFPRLSYGLIRASIRK